MVLSNQAAKRQRECITGRICVRAKLMRACARLDQKQSPRRIGLSVYT